MKGKWSSHSAYVTLRGKTSGKLKISMPFKWFVCLILIILINGEKKFCHTLQKQKEISNCSGGHHGSS